LWGSAKGNLASIICGSPMIYTLLPIDDSIC
jgi:hypothetical protein